MRGKYFLSIHIWYSAPYDLNIWLPYWCFLLWLEKRVIKPTHPTSNPPPHPQSPTPNPPPHPQSPTRTNPPRPPTRKEPVMRIIEVFFFEIKA